MLAVRIVTGIRRAATSDPTGIEPHRTRGHAGGGRPDRPAGSRVDHGQFDLHPEPMPLGELVAEAVVVEAGHEFPRCTMVVEPHVTAVADSMALVRIVRSLVSNGVKHTDGRVEVTVRSVFDRFERLGNHLRRAQAPAWG